MESPAWKFRELDLGVYIEATIFRRNTHNRAPGVAIGAGGNASSLVRVDVEAHGVGAADDHVATPAWQVDVALTEYF